VTVGTASPRTAGPTALSWERWRMLATSRAESDRFHEECGVFGVYGHPDAAALTALGLHALQHRGQEAAGIVAYDGVQFSAHRGPGLVSDNFSSKEVIARLPGAMAIGHC